jgi:hypothetical protein
MIVDWTPRRGDEFVDAMTHPLLRELLAMLPPPEAAFSRQRQHQWVEAAGAVLKLVYGDEDDPDADDAQDFDYGLGDAGLGDYVGEPHNGARAWATNGHEVAGRHRRVDFGRL